MLACLTLCPLTLFSLPAASSSIESFNESLYSSVASPSDHTMDGATTHSGFSVSLYYSDVELEELDAGPVTFGEVPRERIGVQLGWGPGYLRVYEETVDAPVLGTEFDGFGFGLGVQGAYVTHSNAHASYLLDYELSVDLGFLEEDVADAEALNLSVEGKFGPGFAKDWFRASAGLAACLTTGTIEVPGFDDIDTDSQNFGFYASVGYRCADVPVIARVDAHFGDIGGLAFTLGYSF